MQIIAASFAAGALWRAYLALDHLRASSAAADDPSIQELEQLSAAIEGGFALVLLAHGGALLVLSRRPRRFSLPYALAVAVACAALISASWLGAPLISLPGVFAVAVVVSVAVLSHVLRFGWLALYLGALAGSLLGWLAVTPAMDLFAGLFVVAPCVAFAFLGAGLRLLVVRRAGAKRSG